MGGYRYRNGEKNLRNALKELGSELGIVPGHEITDLCRQLRMEWAESASSESSEENTVIKGRTREALLLKNIYRHFSNGAVHAVMIDGENGVGKTYLVQNLLESIKEDSILHLSGACFFAEKDTPLYPWNTLAFK